MSFSTPSLLQLIASGDSKSLAAILASGADVNSKNDGGQTLLILTVISGQDHMIDLLLNAGADPLLRDHTGLNAIDWAERKGRPDLVSLLQTKRTPKVATEVTQPKRRPTVTDAAESTNPSAEEKTLKFLAGLRQRFAENPHRSSRPKQDPRRLEAKHQSAKIKKQSDEPATKALVVRQSAAAPPKLERARSFRKRCPQCNTIYDSPILAYCSYHVVPLVDIDAAVPDSQPKTSSWPIWTLVIATFVVAAVGTVVVSNVFFTSDSRQVTSASEPSNIRKGVPVAGGQLTGKAISLPTADVPRKNVEQAFSISVKVKVDRLGRVVEATSLNSESVLKEAAIAAAKRSTFSPEKLGGRGTEGIITYTFLP